MAKTLGVACSAQLSRVSAPRALCSSFAPLVPSWMVSRRSIGSSMSAGSCTNIEETLFEPWSSGASSARTDTGTTPTSGLEGSSSPPRRKFRSAPVQMASTTSLTVVPRWFFRRFTSSRPTAEKATDRRRVREPLKDVRGAERGRAALPSPGSPSDRLRTRRTLRTRRPVVTRSRVISKGRMVRATAAWVMSSSWDGIRPSVRCSGVRAGGSGSGDRSKRIDSSSAPDTPSTVEWCILVMKPIRSLARPSMTHISHSGFERSSWRPVMSPAMSASSFSPPGFGTAARRTW